MNPLKKNKAMMINFSRTILFLLFTFFIASCENAKLFEYEEVSMINLLSNLEEFQGVKIKFSGYYADIGHDGPIIYYSKEMLNAHSAMDGIRINSESLDDLTDMSQCEGILIEVRGRLKKMPFLPTNNNVMLVELSRFRDVESDISCVKKH